MWQQQLRMIWNMCRDRPRLLRDVLLLANVIEEVVEESYGENRGG